MTLCTTELFIYIHSNVRTLMKNKCYNVIIKCIRESEDIILLLLVIATGLRLIYHGKSGHVSAILFDLKDFNIKRLLKTFVEALTCTPQSSKGNVPRYSLTNPGPIDKILVKNIKFGGNLFIEFEQKNCYDTFWQAYQMTNILIMIV